MLNLLSSPLPGVEASDDKPACGEKAKCTLLWRERNDMRNGYIEAICSMERPIYQGLLHAGMPMSAITDFSCLFSEPVVVLETLFH